MKLERGRDQQEAWRVLSQIDPWKVAPGAEFATFDMPADAHPVVEGLQRQMEIGGCLQLDHRQPARTVRCKQIEEVPVSRGESGYLAVHRRRFERRIYSREAGAHLALQPGFGFLA